MIEEFIKKRFKKDADWLNGNCYWFAFILKGRFPELEIFYDPVEGHFFATDSEYAYDFSGKHLIPEKAQALEDIKNNDPQWYQRLVRDCIN